MNDNDEFEVIEETNFDQYVKRARRQTKINEFKLKVKIKFEQFKTWIGRKSLTEILTDITIIGSIIGMILKATKLFKKSGTERLADQRDFGYYDPHTGIRWDLKRKLTNNEKHELRVRMEAGEPAEDILKDLGVYKYK